MGSAHVVLEMEHLDEIVVISIGLFRRNTLRIDLRVLVEVENRMLTSWLAIELVGTALIDADPAFFSFARKLCLLNQCLD